MAFYGDNATIRKDFLSGGVTTGHPQYQSEAEVDDDLITNGRKYAFEIINSLLRGRFGSAIPFTSGSEAELIKQYSNIIAAWWITNKRYRHLQSVVDNPFQVEYETTIEALKEHAKTGEGIDSVTPAKAAAFFTHNNRIPVFDIDDEFEHVADQDRLDDIADART